MYMAKISVGMWGGDRISRQLKLLFSDNREAWIKDPLTSQIPWIIDRLHCDTLVKCAESIRNMLNEYIAVVFSVPRIDGWGQILLIYSKIPFRVEIEDVAIFGSEIVRKSEVIKSRKVNEGDDISTWTLVKNISKAREEAVYISKQ